MWTFVVYMASIGRIMHKTQSQIRSGHQQPLYILHCVCMCVRAWVCVCRDVCTGLCLCVQVHLCAQVCSSTIGQCGVPFSVALHLKFGGTVTHWSWSSAPRLPGQWTPGIYIPAPHPDTRVTGFCIQTQIFKLVHQVLYYLSCFPQPHTASFQPFS